MREINKIIITCLLILVCVTCMDIVHMCVNLPILEVLNCAKNEDRDF
jgi:hypothetical protein